MADDLLARIDTLAALCPCGADPAEGSAYCCDDCRPTHVGLDTRDDWEADNRRTLGVENLDWFRLTPEQLAEVVAQLPPSRQPADPTMLANLSAVWVATVASE